MTERMKETIAMVQKYCRFTVRKKLTELVGFDDWCIYRDPENGMYALNPWINEEVNLNVWNVTLNNPKLDKEIMFMRTDISDYIEHR